MVAVKASSLVLLVVVACCQRALAVTPSSQVAALEALYASTGGASWTVNTNWMTGDPCANRWYGVTCNANSEVTSLVLQHNNLVGTLPSNIGGLNTLQFFYLSVNKVSGSIPSSIGSLTDLIQLGFDNNSLSGDIPSEFTHLYNLQSLFLQNNQLTGNLSAVANTTALRYFYASNNKLSGEIPTEIGNFKFLTQIGVDGNHLLGSVPAGFGTQQYYLQSFFCQNNDLTGSFPTSICKTSNCDAAGNNFACPVPPTCCQITTCSSPIL